MIEKFNPSLSYEFDGDDIEPFMTMKPCSDGEWVRLETVLDWLKGQSVDDVDKFLNELDH